MENHTWQVLMGQARTHIHTFLECRLGNVVQMFPGRRGPQEKTGALLISATNQNVHQQQNG